MPVSRPRSLPKNKWYYFNGFSKGAWYSLMNKLLTLWFEVVFKHGIFKIGKIEILKLKFLELDIISSYLTL